MGYKFLGSDFDNKLKELQQKYKIYAPVLMAGKGNFSDTDSVRYAEIKSIYDIEFNKKANFSAKEVVLPITQTLFYFTEDSYIEPKLEEKEILLFLRSCDIHALKRTDDIYLKNGAVDPYYKALRDKVKLVLMGCSDSFENCFCVSMGTNETENYDLYVKLEEDMVYIDVKNQELLNLFDDGFKHKIVPDFVKENHKKVTVPDNIDKNIFTSKLWEQYNARCIACGKCNFVCPTCTCFTMQDIHYKDNPKNGERRRVWASCQVDGYSDMAGGHSFRKKHGERMRFKVMHKVYDYNKRFGYHMCVGCGRCDDACPQYISFSHCVNTLNTELQNETFQEGEKS
jgi:anaerobic sulfite reductase subunit A